ncbi:MAG: class III signal peptide-containing protein [Candidatus Omnitrophota bacterium]
MNKSGQGTLEYVILFIAIAAAVIVSNLLAFTYAPGNNGGKAKVTATGSAVTGLQSYVDSAIAKITQ